MILIPLSKVPGSVVLDVLARVHRPAAGKSRISSAIIRQFMADCMHESQVGPGARITDIIDRLQSWGHATGRWTSVLPSCRQMVAILRGLGLETHRGHSNKTAVIGWKLN